MNLETSFAPLLDVILKSTALLLAGAILLAALRKASAANRHAVSVAIFSALLLLPLTKLIPPRWSMTMKPDPVVTIRVELPPAVPIETSALPASAPSSEMGVPPVVSVPWVIPWKTIFVATWLAGAALLMARRLRISLQLRALARSSSPIRDEKLAAFTRELAEASGIRATVRESALCRVPVVTGDVRPIVLLPEDAHEWSEPRIAFALRHEFGHIRRRDCLTRLLGEVVCALYWMNPLVWLAARQMRLAQEQACDDLVLNAGAPADEYAGQLVDAVRSLRADHLGTHHALAMAQPSTLETRVLAIMEPTRNRSSLSTRGALGGGTFAVVMLSVCAAAQLRGAQKPESIAPAADESKAGAIQLEVVVPGRLPEKADWLYPKLDFREATLREVTEYLVAASKKLDPAGRGVNIVIKEGTALNEATITLSLTQVPIEDVLKHVASLAHAEVVKGEFAFLLQPIAAPGVRKAEPAVKPDAATPVKIEGAAWKKAGTIILPKLEFREALLAESIDFLRGKAKQLDPAKEGVNLVLYPAAQDKDSHITLSLTDIPLSEALRYVAQLADFEIVADERSITLRPIVK